MKDRKFVLLFYDYEARGKFLKIGGKSNCDSWVHNKNINSFNWRVACCISHTRAAPELFRRNRPLRLQYTFTHFTSSIVKKKMNHSQADYLIPIERAIQLVSPAKKIGTARQIFGTVLTILRHGTPNFRRVNVSVPNVMWHQCSKFLGVPQEVVSTRVNEARCQKFGVPCRFFLARVKWGLKVYTLRGYIQPTF